MTIHAFPLRAALLLSLCLASTAVAQTAPEEASAERRAEASQRFRRGVDLYAEGDYEGALIEFNRANEALPTFMVLFNIGQTHLAMRHYVASLEAFERYLELGGDRVPAARRAEVEQQIVNLRARTGHLLVRVNVDGAEIRVDDDIVGTSPMTSAIAIDLGRHRVEVRAPEHETRTENVEIAGGDTTELVVELVENPYFVQPVAEAEEPARPLRTLGIVGFVLTGSLFAGATATGVLTLQANSDFEDEIDRRPGDEDAIRDARDRVHTRALTTDILIGSTLAIGAASLTFLLLDKKSNRDPEEASVGLTLGIGRIGAYGTF